VQSFHVEFYGFFVLRIFVALHAFTQHVAWQQFKTWLTAGIVNWSCYA